MRRSRRALGGVLAAMLALGLSGCWDQFSLDQRQTALAISAKPGPRGTIQWRAYFPNPTVNVSSLSQISSHDQFFQYHVEASTLAAALQAIQDKLANDLYTEQLQVFIVSPRFSTQQLASLIGAYNRQAMLPKSAYVLASATPASAFPIKIQQPPPTVFFDNYFNCRTCHPLYLAMRAWRFWDRLVTPGVSPVLPYSTSALTVRRLLVYPPQGLPVIFGPKASEGWALLTNHVVNESLTLNTQGDLIGLDHIRSHAMTQVVSGRDGLRVNVRIQVRACLNQWPPSRIPTLAGNQAIARKVSFYLATLANRAIAQAEQSHTDPFGWQRSYLFRHPRMLPPTRVGINAHLSPVQAKVTVTTQMTSQGVSE
ncbi:MAG: hypothetical protein M1600_12525 [Firmicutes bacterium]|nr:hypothetical protein [Bacillota bacterium]